MTLPQTLEKTLPLRQRQAPAQDTSHRSRPAPITGRVPRVARLLALALRLEELVRNGTVRHYAELARLGQVSNARVSQIMNLRCLAPDIQEAILFLPPLKCGRAKLTVAHLQHVAAVLDWPTQRQRWRALLQAKGLGPEQAPDERAPSSERAALAD